MKTLLATAAAGLVLALGAPAQAADSNGIKAETPVVVERNSKGHATKVRVGDTVYAVCMTEGQDSCIQPRAAGLKWGDRPLRYWPGNRS